MNNIEKLIKAKVISFAQVMIKNYHCLEINSVECMILIKLYYMEQESNLFLDIDKLKQEMFESVDVISNEILKLVSLGFVELSINNNGAEEFSLSGTYQKLSKVLDNYSDEPKMDRKEKLSIIVEYVEATYGKVLSSNDLRVINTWLDEEYEIEEIKDAVLSSLKAKKLHIKYADAILVSRKRKVAAPSSTTTFDEELRILLESAYEKK